MYAEEKELYERAIPIIRTAGDRREEAITYGGLGNLLKSLGEYVKAKEFEERALAISIEIDHSYRKGQAAGYGNLSRICVSISR